MLRWHAMIGVDMCIKVKTGKPYCLSDAKGYTLMAALPLWTHGKMATIEMIMEKKRVAVIKILFHVQLAS